MTSCDLAFAVQHLDHDWQAGVPVVSLFHLGRPRTTSIAVLAAEHILESTQRAQIKPFPALEMCGMMLAQACRNSNRNE